MAQNEQVYAICCQPEVDDDVISGRNKRTTQSYAVVNFEGASFSTFRDFTKRSFFSRGSDMNAICSRPEVADDAISGTDNLQIPSSVTLVCTNGLLGSAVFEKIYISHLCNA